jgi:hypothetical protein
LDGAGASSSSVHSAKTEHGRYHGRWPGRAQAQAQATVHETTQGFFLRDLGYERNSFCELTTVKTDHGKLATGRWLGRSSTAVGTTSGGALAPRASLAVVVQAGGPPPSDESVWESPVWWLDGSVVARQWRLGFRPNSHGIGHYLLGVLH